MLVLRKAALPFQPGSRRKFGIRFQLDGLAAPLINEMQHFQDMRSPFFTWCGFNGGFMGKTMLEVEIYVYIIDLWLYKF